MVDDNNGPEEERFEDVYGPEVFHGIQHMRAKTDFQAWHHPRKQYVRIEQWCSEVQKLIPKLGLAAGDPFRYLTLPGNELLDVRALHGVCERAKVKLRYLGFNSVGTNAAAQAELALSQSEVLALEAIDPFSGVVEDRLETITNELSPGYGRAQKASPFHAINLDLCESISFREVGGPKGSPLEATGRLLALQLQSTAPWLLFITTKAQPTLVGGFARDGFSRALGSNAEASLEFRSWLAALVSSDLDALDAGMDKIWQQQDASFLKLFTTGLGKWLLAILSRAAPPRQLSLVSSCYYQSGPGGPDMLSLAFLCEAPVQQLVDPNAILRPMAAVAGPSEIESAIRLMGKIDAMFDLDAHLSADPELQKKLIKQSARLVAMARYAEDDYCAWAEERFRA